MAKLKIGTVGYVNMGEWNSETIYNKLKVVTYEGSSYASLIDNNIGNIPTDKNYWQLMASKGDKGDKPINGQDYNTDEDKETIKNIIVENAKPDIDEYVTEQKKVLEDKEKEIVSELENEKSILIDEIVDSQSGFDNNAKTKTAKFNENVEFQTKVASNIIDEKISRITEGNIDIDPNAEIVDARSGFPTLGSIIKQKIYHFNNVEEMKNCLNLIPGDVVETLGYYEENDGGGATYKIRTKTSEDVEDGGSIHTLINELVAELIIKNSTVNIKQLGAKCDSLTDNAIIIQNALNKFANIYVPSSEEGKSFLISSPITLKFNGQHLSGQSISRHDKKSSITASSDFEGDAMIKITHGIERCKIDKLCVQGISSSIIEYNGIDINSDLNDTTSLGYHLISDCYILAMPGIGINCSNYHWGTHFHNVEISDCKKGLLYNGTDSLFEGVEIHSCKEEGAILGDVANSSGANCISDFKVYCCCKNKINNSAVILNSTSNRINNINIQQNYGSGLLINGDCQLITNIQLDGNGYLNYNNNLSSLIINSNKNRVIGTIYGNIFKGCTKYGITATENAVALNHIDLTIDEIQRTAATSSEYNNLPTMQNLNVPFNNYNNVININNIAEVKSPDWQNFKDLIITTSDGLIYNIDDNNFTITPNNDGFIQCRFVASSLDKEKPVLICRAKVKSLKPYGVKFYASATDSVQGDTIKSGDFSVGFTAAGKENYIYYVFDFTKYNIDVENVNWFFVRFLINKYNNLESTGDIIIENAQYYWTNKMEDYNKPEEVQATESVVE